jgi:hypothetical protein
MGDQPLQIPVLSPDQVVSEQVKLAAEGAIKSLSEVSSGLRINRVSGGPGVVTISQIADRVAATRTQIFENINTILGQAEPPTNIDALLKQQIPEGDTNSDDQTRAKNIILATLISLPPNERAVVMANPLRLQMTCKNAIFGSRVSNNDKICAVCAGNIQRSPAFGSLGSLPKEKQDLAYCSLNRLEMLMAGSGLDDSKKEGVRRQAMAFFNKATFSDAEWKFPKSKDSDETENLQSDRKDLESLALAHLLRFIDEESRSGLPLDRVHMQKDDGNVDDTKTVKAFVDDLLQPQNAA